jgi:hypothetical protein
MNLPQPHSNPDRNHDNIRMGVWCHVWVNVARSDNCDDPKIATNWADRALEDFDARFLSPAELVEQEAAEREKEKTAKSKKGK